MKMHSPIPYGRQSITEDDVKAVSAALLSDHLTQGPRVQEFEENFAEYVGSKHAVAVSNATCGLHLSVLALGVAPGKKVITTPNSFVATSNCILYAGGEVEFADIDPKTYCLDPNRVEDLLKRNPGAYSGVIPVDFAGLPVRLQDFKDLSSKYGVWLIEDACHAPGATFTSRNGIERVGNGKFADISSFSFHPVKHIATGEGGMLTTNDEKIFSRLRLLRTHGITKDPTMMSEVDGGWDYEMQGLGFNYRIPDILCALGISQLKRADVGLLKRNRIAQRYFEELCDLPITLPFIEPDSTHAFHLFVIQTDKRKELYDFLRSRGIFPQVHYIPIHQQPYYINRYGKQCFQMAEDYYSRCLSIPMYPTLSDEDQGRVIAAIRSFYD